MTTKQTTTTQIPRHIAIIMDGNGRWARKRGLPRIEGHRVGAEAVRTTVRACGELGVEYLTLYAFSSENWARPKAEITALMQLLKLYLRKEISELNKNNVRLLTIGAIQNLSVSVQAEIKRAQELTAQNRGLKLVLALNYGARQEILEAVNHLIEDVKNKKINGFPIDEKQFASYLYTADIPDPDLLIRTSGEMRVSNFLLWQISYSEMVMVPAFWPDFNREYLEQAILEYQKRDRRFGGI